MQEGEGGSDGSLTMAVGEVGFESKAEDRLHPWEGFATERIAGDLVHKIVLSPVAIARWAQARQRAVEHSVAPAGD